MQRLNISAPSSSILRVFFWGSLLASLISLYSQSALAQGLDDSRGGAVEIVDPPKRTQPQVGRKAAEKYMAPRAPGPAPTNQRSEARRGPDDHYLALHLGGFVSDNQYKWGNRDSTTNVGRLNTGLTYRIGEWVNSMDLAFRFEVSTFSLEDGRASKLSFLPIITFPDASSRFPLYFGFGAGLGIFVNQLGGESPLSLDYQLLGGARFFDVFNNTGFFIEGGLKNHLFLLSDGQFNGAFVTVGTVFTF